MYITLDAVADNGKLCVSTCFTTVLQKDGVCLGLYVRAFIRFKEKNRKSVQCV